jgi:hypothetical protein
MTLRERDLEFSFEGAINAVKFDDGTTHASSSLQAVDFVVEYEDHFRFVEVKDPDEPGAVNVAAFREKFRSGQLIRSLAGKYRDSCFFLRLKDETPKDVEYIVLLSMSALDDAMLLAKQDELHRSIPFSHPAWPAAAARTCVIMSVSQWKRRFGDDSLRRLSEAP